MANKHLSEDQIQYTVDVKTSKAQQEIHKLEVQSASLRNENKQRLQQMIKLEASGKKETEQYKNLAASYKDTGRKIRELSSRIQEQTRSLDINAMTMSQLKKQSKYLQKELDNVSKALNPQQYSALEKSIQTVNARMSELKQNSKNVKELLTSDQFNNFFLGQLGVKTLEIVARVGKSIAGGLSEAIDKSVELAESADGVIHAFEKIGTEDYLQTLRDATKGTVSDIDLMKAAVKAKDFRIPLEDLGKYLSFAQLKAQQTGQSLDYMVDSIVTGLGRQSPQILDNLGLSAAEIKEQTKETGDFMKGVATIVENNLAQAGETYISAADRAAKRTADLENAQLSLGKTLLPLKDEFTDIYGQIQIGAINAIKYIVKHRDTLWVLAKVVALLTATYLSYVAAQKVAYLWSLRAVAVSKLKAAAAAVENAMLQLSILRHAVLNKTMTTSIALQKAFNVVLKLSPWGVVLGGITLVVGALLMFNKRADAATIAQKKLNDIHDEANRKVEEERIKIEMLTRRIHDNSLSLDERRAAISALQKIVPDYTAKLSKEGRVYDENTAALTRYINALKEKALLEGAKEELKKLAQRKAALIVKQNQQAKAQEEAKREQAQFTQQNAGRPQTSQGAVAPAYTFAAMGHSGNVSALSKQIEKTGNEIKAVNASIDAIGKEFGKKMLASESSPTSKSGTAGAQIDTTTKKTKKGKTKKQKPGKTVNPDDIASRKFSHDRQQDLEEVKRSYEEDLNALNEALAQKRLTQEQYNAYVSALNIEHQNNLLAIEKSYQEKANNLVIKDAAKKKTIKEQQNKAVADQQQAAYDAYVEAERQYYDALEKIQETAPAKPQTLQKECDAKLLVLDGYYKAALQRAGEDGERQKEVTEAYEKAKAAIVADYAKKIEEERARARQEYGIDTFSDQLAARRKKIDEDFAKGILNKEQHQQAITNLEKQAEEQRLQIRQQYGLASQQELYNAENEQLKEHLRQGLITQEEYEEAVKNLKISRMKEAFDYYSNLAGGAVQALQQAEMANVDAKYDAEIEAARNAGKDTTELEKKKTNEQLKIQKKYADINFAIKASQIVADTSVSIMKALGELGPIAGPIAAALMGITGAAQLAAANAERQKVKRMSLNGAGGASSASGTRVVTGLESGGSIDVEREQDGKRFHADYDPYRRGFIDKPTVIVGEGGYGRSREWVASNAAVENPTVAPFLNIIDQAQRAGNIRTLDMNKFLLHQAQGRAAGGYIAPSAPTLQPMPTAITHRDEYNKELLETLKELRNNGIRSYVALDDFDAQQKLRNQVRRIASK
ncbi:2-oxoacid:ferredoxin oxidoreductase subunit delta [Prevotella corporis]|uniref:2-oxoacid:ferredoxin oxidoreductase subunit delta n=1 Tax=Prevotella corporis TaxID=28128 RepID=UPI002366FC24|nr:2-oxoacid:ferredoxin oxidoreductase subunit delta [Prevotella corporis]